MIRILKLYCLFLFVSFDCSGQLNEYNYKREIIGIKDEWHRIELPDALFSKLSSTLTNFRIFGLTPEKDTIEVPYLINLLNDKVSRNEVKFELINQSKNEKGFYFTFKLPTAIEINEIDLDFSLDNYDWKIDLEGSNDQINWFTIVDKYRIVGIENQLTSYSFNRVTFPKSKYTYFRIHIPTKINPEFISPKLSSIQEINGKTHNYKIISKNSVQDKKEKQTIITLTLEQAVPISKVHLAASDKFDFYRNVIIESLVDSIKTENGYLEEYMQVTSGIFSSFEKNEFSLPNIISKKLRITILNYDNQPLTIDKMEVNGFVYEVIARFVQPADYYFVYGTKNEIRPNYDIKHFKELIPSELTELTLGSETEIDHSEKPEKEAFFKSKFWLWAIMAVVILILGGFTFNMLRKVDRESNVK